MRDTRIRRRWGSVEVGECPICGWEPARMAPCAGDFGEYLCEHCGEFVMTGTAKWVRMSSRASVILAGRVRQANRKGEIPEISASHVEGFADHRLPSPRERLKMCLEEALHSMERPTGRVNLLGHPRFKAASYCCDTDEMHAAVGMLISEGWIRRVTDQGHVRLTLKGFDQVSELR